MRLPAIITRFSRRVSHHVLALVVVLLPAALSRDTVHAAEIMVHFRRIGGSPNGKNLVFIYTVKQHRSSAWRIVAMGSGP